MPIPESIHTVINQLTAAGLGSGEPVLQVLAYKDPSSGRVSKYVVKLVERYASQQVDLIDVRQWYRDQVQTKLAFVDPAYARDVVLGSKPSPALLGMVRGDDKVLRNVVMDGTHRLYKAHLSGWKMYPCRMASEADTAKCLLPETQAGLESLHRELYP